MGKKLCRKVGCSKRASYGLFQGDPICCATCKDPEHVDVVHPKCQYEGCKTICNYNYKGEKKGKFCKFHALDNMIDLTKHRSNCIVNGCETTASYGSKDSKKATHCLIHKLVEQVNVRRKRCKFTGCDVTPNFGYESNGKPEYCNSHKLDKMINLVNTRCETEGCNNYSYFGNPGERAKYCKQCAERISDKLIKIKDYSKCLSSPCLRNKSHGYINENKYLYCKTCALEGMVDLTKRKKCKFDGCLVEPCFGIEGTKDPLFCVKHKEINMVDVKSKLCVHPSCKLRASYGDINVGKVLYCTSHKEIGMVNLKLKTCLHENCIKKPYYNYLGQSKPLWCREHCSSDCVNVISKCIYQDCRLIASFNFKDKRKAIYCKKHSQDGMINVNNNICISENCDILAVVKKYKGYCLSCFVHLFPDEPNTLNYKTKEKHITDYIKEKLPNLDWIIDRKVYDGCSRRRPDIFLDLGYQVLVVEIDENQHIDYDCSCENKRLMEISQDINHRPLIFIRFNPDGYKKDNKQITSCWIIDVHGICVIKKDKTNEWNERLTNLESQIRYWIDPENKTDKTVEVIQLYYDQ